MVKSRVPMNSCRARGHRHQHELEPRRSAPAVRAQQAQPVTEQKWDTHWWDTCFLRPLGKPSSRQLSPVLRVYDYVPSRLGDPRETGPASRVGSHAHGRRRGCEN